ncbi:peptidase S11 D-alanyl-D-alanine carboxypeptidase 1 [Acidimicrobium ferrooxidans DSM 10331]|uniref:Peptidase S11 D-alanyl-D-alanine carboxypeptidase 1 n=1 Tax=Acidimicrobium ferrooxidans (strain DSM 10331 / JCM 15462 / NBRC 103882 / ICP) TaxID=525909 RepID=C7LZN0_ACIFD|nr:serine hydrolase [Acidimicrobium ferrooxidans]ACU54188.1 peptidase S11 D-alanyl-D-alanine carboxypeptidase 1 [Acidimicrobium ferrooxidans DSM 10331]
MPRALSRRRRLRQRRAVTLGAVTVAIVAGTGVIDAALTLDPSIRVTPRHVSGVRAPTAPPITFKHGVQSATVIPALGSGSLEASPHERPVPIASLAKLMTALIVVRRHPLGSTASGPTLTMTPADVILSDVDVAEDQSTVPITAGERLNERQLLEALLVRSANNIATILATWVAGSESAFVATMNATARTMGLTGTHFADASGFNKATVSTARDVAIVTARVEDNPTLAAIASEHAVTLPGAGTLPNIIQAIGTGDVVGVKSGFTIWSGGCASIAVRTPTPVGELTSVGVVIGEQGYASLARAARRAQALATTAAARVASERIIDTRELVGWARAPWRAAPIPIVAARSVRVLLWPATEASVRIALRPPALPAPRGRAVGEIVVTTPTTTITVPAILTASLGTPSFGWRLTHAL